MKTPSTTLDPNTARPPFDPWPSALPPGQRRPQPQIAPGEWYLLTTVARGAVGAAALAVLAAHPDRTGRGEVHFLSHRLREELTRLNEAGDPGARAALEFLQTARGNNSTLCYDVMLQLLDAGGLLPTLKRERAALDAAIAQLEQLTAARG